MLDIALWTISVFLMGVGLAGTVVPILPGLPMILAGAWLAGFVDNYAKIGFWTLIILAILTVIGVAIEWISQALGAKKAGATKLGILGSLIGTVLGIFTGLWGLIFMPLIGAAVGEFIGHQDLLRAGKVGIATWIGMIVGTVVKLGLAFTMIGVVVAALLMN